MTREEENSLGNILIIRLRRAAGINTRWMGLRLAKSRSRRFRAAKAKAKPVQNKTVRVRADDGEALGKGDEAKWSDWCNRTLPPGCVWQGQDDIVVAPSFILRGMGFSRPCVAAATVLKLYIRDFSPNSRQSNHRRIKHIFIYLFFIIGKYIYNS